MGRRPASPADARCSRRASLARVARCAVSVGACPLCGCCLPLRLQGSRDLPDSHRVRVLRRPYSRLTTTDSHRDVAAGAALCLPNSLRPAGLSPAVACLDLGSRGAARGVAVRCADLGFSVPVARGFRCRVPAVPRPLSSPAGAPVRSGSAAIRLCDTIVATALAALYGPRPGQASEAPPTRPGERPREPKTGAIPTMRDYPQWSWSASVDHLTERPPSLDRTADVQTWT